MIISIIGGTGGIGKRFVEFFNDKGIEAYGLGRGSENFDLFIEKSNVIFIAVPISAVSETIDKISLFNLENKIVINLASNMSEGFGVLQNLKYDVCCIHPLFGPDIDNFKNQQIVVAPRLDSQYLAEIILLFEQAGAKVVFSTPEDHDRMMGYVQALSQIHFVTVEDNLTTFRMNLETIERILKQPSELWRNIQFSNKFFAEILEEYEKSFDSMRKLLIDKDSITFDSEFNLSRNFFARENKSEVSETHEKLNQHYAKNSVGILGPKGTYTHQAAQALGLGSLVFFDSIPEVLDAITQGKVERVVLPLENALEGTVMQTLDGLYVSKLHITQELILPINHCLAGLNASINLQEVTQIYSHPQALGQCRNYIQKNFQNAKLILTPSTAAAFKKIKEEGLTNALAIGPTLCGEVYGLQVLDENIQDIENNTTAFILVQKEASLSNVDKTMLVIDPQQDRVGLLLEILQLFKERNINLSKIESRPSREKLGAYIFYVVLDRVEEQDLNLVLKLLEEKGMLVTSLGSYSTRNA